MSKKASKMEGITPKIHPVRISGYVGSNYDLGRAITSMRYDQVCEVIRGMIDALGDEIKGDTTGLDQTNARIYLNLAILYCMKALQACRPPNEGEKK